MPLDPPAGHDPRALAREHGFALSEEELAFGAEEGVGEWFAVDQERIDAFADATLDHQFIHVDPEKAAKLSAYKVAIAHGFLTLSLVPHLGGKISPVEPKASEGLVMGVNHGLDKVRFPSPVKVDSKVRARRTLAEVEPKAPNTLQLKQVITIEIEGESKPACVAESLTRLVTRTRQTRRIERTVASTVRKRQRPRE